MSADFDFSAEAAATNAELSLLMASLKGKTFDELKSILPPATDRQKIQELIAVVNGAAGGNDRVASFRSVLGKLGTTAVTMLKAAI